jgi:hypothetical protein
MPRGRPKKQSAEAELLPPEDNQSSPKVIKHKTEWVEVVEETPDSDGAEFEDAEIEDRPRKKNKNAIQEMRKKLRAQGVTPTSNLRLYIERYVHSETDAGGSWAETEFCTKYSTTEEHIFNKDYIDAARKWGPGKYRITIRMDNRIVDAFDERISATPTAPVVQHINPNDPTSPQVIYQTNGDGQQQAYQPPSVRDIMKAQKEAFKEQLEMAKLMREAYGLSPEQQQQPRSEEEILSSAILKQPEVIENVVGSVLKRFGGKSGSDDDAPWYADIVRKAVESGQAAQIVQVAIDRIFNGVSGLFPGGQNNGQAQVVQTPMQNQTQPNQQQVLSIPSQQATSDQSLQPSSPPASDMGSGGAAGQIEQTASQTTPEQHALARLIENCQRNVPVQVAYQQLVSYADAIEDQAPEYSIYGYIDLLGSMPTDQVIEFVKTLPDGEQIAALPHARQWTTELQKLIKESQEGEE